MNISVLALAVVMSASAQTGPSGHWEGTTPSPKGPTKVSVDLKQNASGEWIGSLGVPEAKASGLRIINLEVSEKSVKFVSVDTPNSPTFDLDFTEGRLRGMLRSGTFELPVDFIRTGEPHVELPPGITAVSKALEGNWEGTIALPNNTTRVVLVHFANKSDGTAEATLDSPTLAMKGALLENVSEHGSDVSFALRIYGGSYKGTMNAKGTELVGNWTQNPAANPLPLTFRKK